LQPLSSLLPAGPRLLPPPLPAAPSACLATGLPHEGGGLRAYHVPLTQRSGLGRVSRPVVRHLPQGTVEAPAPDHGPFGSSLAAASGSDTRGPHLACRTSRFFRPFTWVDPTTPSWLPTASLLVVAVSAHASAASPGAEATLSRRLRTPPLPAAHAAVGNHWQNRGLCQSMTAQQLRQRPRVAPAPGSASVSGAGACDTRRPSKSSQTSQ
jgi:hypothetical protein